MRPGWWARPRPHGGRGAQVSLAPCLVPPPQCPPSDRPKTHPHLGYWPSHSRVDHYCGSDGKRIHLQGRRPGFNPWVGKIHGEGNGNPLQYSCLENPYVQRSLAGCSTRGHKELDMNEWLSTQHSPFFEWVVYFDAVKHHKLFVSDINHSNVFFLFIS